MEMGTVYVLLMLEKQFKKRPWTERTIQWMTFVYATGISNFLINLQGNIKIFGYRRKVAKIFQDKSYILRCSFLPLPPSTPFQS